MKLSESEAARFERDGYLSPLRAISAAEANQYRAELEAFEARHGGRLKGVMRFKVHLLMPWVDRLMRHPAILDPVESLIGGDILAVTSIFFIKEAQDPAFISWHQDLNYSGLEPGDIVTAWLALSPSTPESGNMRVIPGTHHHAVVPHRDTFHPHNMLSRGQEIAVEVDEAAAVDITLQPGEFSLHHTRIFHYSGANHGADRRIGLAFRYAPTHVRQVRVERDSAALVRGVDRFGHFELEPPAQRELDPSFVALHALAAQRQAEALYKDTEHDTFRPEV